MSALPGSGLLAGLRVTLATMTRRAVTEQYPQVKPELPPRSRGVIALLEGRDDASQGLVAGHEKGTRTQRGHIFRVFLGHCRSPTVRWKSWSETVLDISI